MEWAPSVCAGPLTTSLRGLWVGGLLPPCIGGTRRGGDPKTDQVTQGELTHNSRAGNPKRTRPNFHEKRYSRTSVGIAPRGGAPKNPVYEGEVTQGPCRRGATDFCRLSRQLLVPIPQRPQQELEELSLEEGEPPREAAVEPEPERQEELRVDPSAKKDKRLKIENTKSDTLGSNPKAARVRARTQLQKGYYRRTTGRNSTRVLHRLGTCHMVPGIDNPRYVYSGPQMPKQGDFDSICELCSRKRAEVAHGDSDVTQTSSSSEEGQ